MNRPVEMKGRTRLCIAIPTFNRPSELARTISSYLKARNSGLMEETYLLIVDNASTRTTPALERLKEARGIVWHSNACNIGAGANYLRCVELAESDFVWLLGDDEYPCFDALPSLLPELTEAITFLPPHSGWRQPSAGEVTIRSEAELWDRFPHTVSLSLLSSWIFRVADARRHLAEGYRAVRFQHPYATMGLKMIQSGLAMRVSEEVLFLENGARMRPRYDWIPANIDAVIGLYYGER